MSKRKRSKTDQDEDSRQVMSPNITLTPNGARMMVIGVPYSVPLVVGLERVEWIQPNNTNVSQDYSYVSAVVCDDKQPSWSTEAYVFNQDPKGRHLFRDDVSMSYVVSVTGYITSQTNTRDSFLCLTSLDILSEKKREKWNSSSLRQLQIQQRVSGGIAGTFLFERAPLFSDSQLAGGDAFCTAVVVRDTGKTAKDFFHRHSAMKTLHESSTSESTEQAARHYMSAVREFASAQLDRQKASLFTNSEHEAADRATLVTNQYRTALEAALTHADTKQDLTIDTLKQWHRLLCGGGLLPEAEAGHLRTKKNRAGTTDFCPPEQVPSELDKVCKGVRALGSRLDGVDSAATFAAAVCFGVLDIHAFTNGNGRLARISTNWALRRTGLPFVINLFATQTQRREYVTAVETTRRNLSIVARGSVDEETLLDVTARAGLLLPLEHLIVDQMSRAAAECSKLVAEKSLLVADEQEAMAARQFREKAAAGTCVICFDDFPNVATLCCGNAVHLNCMAKWLGENNSCPQCRADLPPLPPRVAAPPDNLGSTETETEDFDEEDSDYNTYDDSTEDATTEIGQQNGAEDTILRHDTTDDTTDIHNDTTSDTTDDTTPVPPNRRVLPKCAHCRNRAAADCSNACCGRCCVLLGQFQCVRHNMVS
jgi:fido (protein-threonine AMPylation protein)